MNYPPDTVRNYVTKWADANRESATPAEAAMLDDIVSLVGVAVSVMEKKPTR